MTSNALEPRRCPCIAAEQRDPECEIHGQCRGCGYALDSFACKIRHIQVNAGDAKASLDGRVAPSRNRGIETSQ